VFKVCSSCGQEYQSWATECSDCGVSLDLAPGEKLAPATRAAPALEELVALRLGGPWELQALAEALQAQGISSRIDAYPPGDPISAPRVRAQQGQRGDAARLGIYVSRPDLEAAREVAEEVAARDLPDVDAAGAAHDPTACPACGEPTPENAAACSACGLEFPEVNPEDAS
jgi:hypothetical protein